uniref:Uncharacterized protein n=1 Tax=Anguilla anguilla TaxID=7936 RepID=A0A0E9SDM7_ANGAN
MQRTNYPTGFNKSISYLYLILLNSIFTSPALH